MKDETTFSDEFGEKTPLAEVQKSYQDKIKKHEPEKPTLIAYKEIYNCLVGCPIKSEHKISNKNGKLTINFNDRSLIVVDKDFHKFTALDQFGENEYFIHSNQVNKF